MLSFNKIDFVIYSAIDILEITQTIDKILNKLNRLHDKISKGINEKDLKHKLKKYIDKLQELNEQYIK